MSKIAEYKALKAQLANQLAQLEVMKNDKELKREIEFEEKLHSLLSGYNFGLQDVVAILAPVADRKSVAAQQRAGRKIRAINRYKNPSTGEVIETKGGNHRILKAWKAEYGNATVKGWLQ